MRLRRNCSRKFATSTRASGGSPARPVSSTETRSGQLDLAAAAQGALRNDDRGTRLAAQLLQFVHGAVDRILRKRPELLGGLAEGSRADLERYGNRAGGGHDLGLADVEAGPRCVRFSVFPDWGQAADRPDAPVRENFLEIELVRLELQLGGLEFGRGHAFRSASLKGASLGPACSDVKRPDQPCFFPSSEPASFSQCRTTAV